jgi:predicted nuclease with TOPRIM domain
MDAYEYQTAPPYVKDAQQNQPKTDPYYSYIRERNEHNQTQSKLRKLQERFDDLQRRFDDLYDEHNEPI